jgi:hypothetical protein
VIPCPTFHGLAVFRELHRGISITIGVLTGKEAATPTLGVKNCGVSMMEKSFEVELRFYLVWRE